MKKHCVAVETNAKTKPLSESIKIDCYIYYVIGAFTQSWIVEKWMKISNFYYQGWLALPGWRLFLDSQSVLYRTKEMLHMVYRGFAWILEDQPENTAHTVAYIWRSTIRLSVLSFLFSGSPLTEVSQVVSMSKIGWASDLRKVFVKFSSWQWGSFQQRILKFIMLNFLYWPDSIP
jgi:hypothetical protein